LFSGHFGIDRSRDFNYLHTFLLNRDEVRNGHGIGHRVAGY